MDCKNRALNVEQIEMLLPVISSLKPYQKMYDQDLVTFTENISLTGGS